jgi:hypothetical protein
VTVLLVTLAVLCAMTGVAILIGFWKPNRYASVMLWWALAAAVAMRAHR